VSTTDEDDLLQPLHFAALNGHVDLVELFLRLGVDVNVTDAYGVCLAWLVCSGVI